MKLSGLILVGLIGLLCGCRDEVRAPRDCVELLRQRDEIIAEWNRLFVSRLKVGQDISELEVLLDSRYVDKSEFNTPGPTRIDVIYLIDDLVQVRARVVAYRYPFTTMVAVPVAEPRGFWVSDGGGLCNDAARCTCCFADTCDELGYSRRLPDMILGHGN